MSFTRRSIIAGIAMPAVLPAASVAATYVPDPQREAALITIGRELEEAERLRVEAHDRLVYAEGQAAYPLEPEVLIATNWDLGNCLPVPTVRHDVRGRTWTAWQIEEIRSRVPRRQDTASAHRRAEILAAYDAHSAAVRTENEAWGLSALEGAYDAACERRDEIAGRIIETPATSVAGLVVKARGLAVLYGEVPQVKAGVITSENAFRSIVVDVLAMGGVA